jgi:hypothetical protein
VQAGARNAVTFPGLMKNNSICGHRRDHTPNAKNLATPALC